MEGYRSSFPQKNRIRILKLANVRKPRAACFKLWILELKPSVRAHLIDCFVEVFGDMKLVMYDLGLGRCLASGAQVGLPHVDSDRFNLVTLLGPEPCPELLAGLSSAVRYNVQNPALFQIGHQADIILPAAKALLVNTNQSQCLGITTLQASFDGSLHDLVRTVPIQPQQPCATADCLAGLQHPNGKGFKHQCKATVLAGPGYLDGFDTVFRAIDPGSACYQNRLKLHGVQVPPPPFRRVVVKGSPFSTIRTWQSPGLDLRS